MSPTSSTEVLATYLHDHLAGAAVGVEMAQRLQKRVSGSPEAAALGRLADDVEHDREELRRLVEALGESDHPLKRAAGWVAGKAHQLAVAESLIRDEHLSLLLQAETMALGIEGKLALWEALRAVAPEYPQLAGVDLVGLAERAREQRGRVETVRLGAARRAFGVRPDSPHTH
jgi:hypothetical protein